MVGVEWLTSQQAADLLSLSVRTVLNMAADGRLPSYRLPGSRRVLFARHEIDETIAASRSDL